MSSERVPVIVLAGHLGSGKTTVLNQLLRHPGSRVGVIVNDFGTINLDAGLVAGYVDQPVAISGGCLCCIEDVGDLDAAMERLARPALDLDAIVIEASGLADPVALGRMVRFSGVERIRPGGVVDVIDAREHERTLDTGVLPPSRYIASSLVLINKTDLLPEAERAATIRRLTGRVRERNQNVPVVAVSHGRIDPTLLFDVRDRPAPAGQLALWEPGTPAPGHTAHDHQHAHAVSVPGDGPADPADLIDLLESPPPGAYRIKGRVEIRVGSRERSYLVNLVGQSIHIAAIPRHHPAPGCLVAIGIQLDEAAAAARLRAVFAPSARSPQDGIRRLRRHLRLSA